MANSIEERLKNLEQRVGALFARVREEHEWTMFMLLDIRKRIGDLTGEEHAEAVAGIWEPSSGQRGAA